MTTPSPRAALDPDHPQPRTPTGDLIYAACAWWHTKGGGLHVSAHLDDPEYGCADDAERALALAVREYLGARKPMSTGNSQQTSLPVSSANGTQQPVVAPDVPDPMAGLEALMKRWQQWAADSRGTAALNENDETFLDIADDLDERVEELEAALVPLRQRVEAQRKEVARPCVCQIDDGLVQEWVSKARAVARSKGYGDALNVVHGRTCHKVVHGPQHDLHGPDDDSPYDVDGVMYCGRCHTALGAAKEPKG